MRLEVKLSRQLDNALIVITSEAGGGDLPKARTVNVETTGRHREVRVVEDIESLKPQFKIEAFSELRPLDKRHIRAPVTRTINRGQAQLAELTCCWIGKEGRVGAPVGPDQLRIKQERKSGLGIIEQPGHAL